MLFETVPGAGIEPARIAPLVFETSASTNSAIRAFPPVTTEWPLSVELCRLGNNTLFRVCKYSDKSESYKNCENRKKLVRFVLSFRNCLKFLGFFGTIHVHSHTIMRLILINLAALLLCAGAHGAEIDRLVNKELSARGIPLSERCGDDVFLRRLYLVTTSRTPPPDIVRQFLEDKSPDKRTKMIDKILASDEYVENQVLKWGDLLRVKSEFSSNIWPNGVQAYNRWLMEQLRDNTPYDVMVKNLLISTGSNFRSPAVNFYRINLERSPEVFLRDINQIFMGMRNYQGGSEPFFIQVSFKKTLEWKEEIVYLNIDKMPIPAALPNGRKVELKKGEDFRIPYAEWLVSNENPQFARTIVNRIWFWLMGVGIVEPADDFHDGNPPSNPELLNYLQRELVLHKYDLRHIFRIILTSDAFSRASLSSAGNRDDDRYFSHYPTRRLSAEQLMDAVCDITGVPDNFSSRAPEPYTHFPRGTRATEIGDGSVTTSQLQLFGRPSRDVSLESDRNNTLTFKQVIFLLNSSYVLNKLEQSPVVKALVDNNKNRSKLINEIYLTTLCRYPDAKEVSAVTSYAEENKLGSLKLAKNLMWALINSDAFIFNH